MRKIKLLTSLFALPILSTSLIPLTSCNKSNSYAISSAESSEGITFIGLNTSIAKGKDIEATYSFDAFATGLNEEESDILVGTTSIKNEEGVVYKGGTIKVPASLITANVTIKIVTIYEEGYITTSWADIITACNTFEASDRGTEAINAFIASFSIQSKSLTSLNDLVGACKAIYINNQWHRVRIIDTQHDTIADTTAENKTSALTFELVTLLSNSNGETMKTVWGSSNQDYINSTLRANLTGNGNGTKSFDKTALSMLPSYVSNGIKTVTKKVATTSSYTVTDYSDKLFPLTYTEMGQSGDEHAKVEGSAYKYWSDHPTFGDRIKQGIDKVSSSYWLASPYTESQFTAWYVYANGSVTSVNLGSEGISVSFGFCI